MDILNLCVESPSHRFVLTTLLTPSSREVDRLVESTFGLQWLSTKELRELFACCIARFKDPKICLRLNHEKGYGCNDEECRYNHRCILCGKDGHGAFTEDGCELLKPAEELISKDIRALRALKDTMHPQHRKDFKTFYDMATQILAKKTINSCARCKKADLPYYLVHDRMFCVPCVEEELKKFI